jgi:xylulokinase
MLLLGIDIGTSSVKVSVVDAYTQRCIASVHHPETEYDIISPQAGWAEQSPEMWRDHTVLAIRKLHGLKCYNPRDIRAIGITYQMHGLVCVDKDLRVLRNSIIWCDNRAIENGKRANEAIGKEHCLRHLLNSPGNFTASKLAWVMESEPAIYEQIHHIMLPGDYIALRMTGELTTTIPALSEGIFWDFRKKELSSDIMEHFGFRDAIIPEIHPVFSEHGRVTASMASELSLTAGIPVSYKAGDQQNNAFSLNVLNPSEVAATAGTSGVIYGVSDQLVYDKASRINSFAHVNHTNELNRIGVLLCINGTGSMNRWLRKMSGNPSYEEMNRLSESVNAGSDGLMTLPFGNGAERMLENHHIHSHLHHIDFNLHTPAHLYRSAQEGIAFAFRYGLDIMRENGMHPEVIRAGDANMFLSEVFTQCFADATDVPVEIYNTDGSIGAATGAGIGAGIYKSEQEVFQNLHIVRKVAPKNATLYGDLYLQWKELLDNQLTNHNIQNKNIFTT